LSFAFSKDAFPECPWDNNWFPGLIKSACLHKREFSSLSVRAQNQAFVRFAVPSSVASADDTLENIRLSGTFHSAGAPSLRIVSGEV
jgi:hypothetical protein